MTEFEQYIRATGIRQALSRRDAGWAESAFDFHDLSILTACVAALNGLRRLWLLQLYRAARVANVTHQVVRLPGIGFVAVSRTRPEVLYDHVACLAEELATREVGNPITDLADDLVQRALVASVSEVAEQDRILQFWNAFRRFAEMETLTPWSQTDDQVAGDSNSSRVIDAPSGARRRASDAVPGPDTDASDAIAYALTVALAGVPPVAQTYTAFDPASAEGDISIVRRYSVPGGW